MSVAVKGTPTSAATTSVALPTHAIGDLIVIYAYRNGSTAIATKPAASGTVPAWVTIDGPTGANTNSLIVCQFVATATNHTSGTWANATNMAAIVLTGQSPAVTGGHAQGGGATTTSPSSPTVTLTDADGSSTLLYMWAANAETAWGTQPTGFTDQLADNTAHIAISTKNDSTVSGAQTRSTTTTSTYRSETVEVVSGPHPTDATVTGESFGVQGPIIYTQIVTAEAVTVQIAGGAATLNVNVSDSTTTTSTGVTASVTGTPPNLTITGADTVTTSNTPTVNPPNSNPSVSVADSTTTSEWIVIAFDPPITFTLEVDVADSVTTGETKTAQITRATSGADTVTTGNTPTVAPLVLPGVNATSSVTTGESVSVHIPGSGTFSELVLTPVASDTFHRADGGLGSGWTATTDGGMAISSDEAIGTSSAIRGDYRTETYDSDQYSEVTLGSVNSVSLSFIGPTVRNDAGGQCYAAIYFESDGGPQIALYKRADGDSLALVSLAVNGGLTEGDTIRLVAEGSQLTTYVNDVSFNSYIDSSLTGGAPGIISFDAVTISEWDGGNAHTGAIASSLATDNFNRSNAGASVGQANWAVMSGFVESGVAAVDVPIISDQLSHNTGSHAAIIRTGETYDNDQWSSLQMGSTIPDPGDGGFVGLLTRVNAVGQSLGQAGYLGVEFSNVNSNGLVSEITYRIYRLDQDPESPTQSVSIFLAGTNAGILDSSGAMTGAFDVAGTAYTLVSQGDRHSFRVNGKEVLATTDDTYATGTIGLMLFPSTTPTTADNWSGGDVNLQTLAINVSDSSTTTSTGVTVQIGAPGTLAIHVSDSSTITNTPTVALPTALHIAVTDSTTVANVSSVRVAGEGLPHDYDLPITMAVESITRGLAVDNPHSIAVQTNTRGLAVETISRTLAVDEPHSIAVQPNIKELAVDGP